MSNSRLPNFLVVGTAKAGTTALADMLGQHPDVFICPGKESFFFNADAHRKLRGGSGDPLSGNRAVCQDHESYKNLFSGVSAEQVIGEVNTLSLYLYETAIPKIREYLGDVKIIGVLRNPIDRAFSAYGHHRRDGHEKLSFKDALEQEEWRKANGWDFMWHYASIGFYAEQVRAYQEGFSQTLFVLYDDLKNSPEETLRRIFGFIGADPAFEIKKNIKTNVSGQPRNRGLHQFLYRFLTRPCWLKDFGRKIIPPEREREVIRMVEWLMRRNFQRKPAMDPETKADLRVLYQQDIVTLQDLLGCDLSGWLPTENASEHIDG